MLQPRVGDNNCMTYHSIFHSTNSYLPLEFGATHTHALRANNTVEVDGRSSNFVVGRRKIVTLFTMHCDITSRSHVAARPFFLKHDSRIIRQSSNTVCGFSMKEQVRLCAVWPTENWLGSSMNHIQDWMTVWESYYHNLEKSPLVAANIFQNRFTKTALSSSSSSSFSLPGEFA